MKLAQKGQENGQQTKNVNEIREVAKKNQQNFQVAKKKVNKIFKQTNKQKVTINSAQFNVYQVWYSDVPSKSLVHQCGKVSGIVDGNLPY